MLGINTSNRIGVFSAVCISMAAPFLARTDYACVMDVRG
jgi:hypothetical protein